ncbi:phosphoribosyltransferase family protein [Campylobacter corcagiensis]|nr:phosphoribosyltransferase family protein [Campylobacter corcagiensis]QKF64371.1 putative phosphoribosyltransferase [Campylobacter corcagiensis]
MLKKDNLMFEDQQDAALKLYEILPTDEIISTKPLIIASSLVAVPLVDIIASRLNLNYEVMFTEKIYSPVNKECLIAMVSETKELVFIEELVKSFDISLDYIYGEADRKYEEGVLKKIYKYRKGALLQSFEGRDILLVDEGCETGITAMVCLKSIISLNPRSVSYATPLIASDTAEILKTVADQIFCVRTIADFVGVDFYYKNKVEPTPELVLNTLEASPHYLPLIKEGEICSTESKSTTK